ncbi:MAG: aminomethyltransferase family protein [Chloroflexi bacterium]|nr:aminomethyltransferase family protein [Chloroflexota bacterium]
MLRGTPFHSRTSALCEGQNWRRWAGYVVAGSYELTHEREYYAIRTTAALIDISPLHKYRIHGPDAVRVVDRIVTRDASKCAVNQIMYTPWCTDAGKVLDDGTLWRLDEQTFRLTAAEPNLHWLLENAIGLAVEIEDESDRIAAVALQGPNSREILKLISDTDLDTLGYFRLKRAAVADLPAIITRTGYTGDLGYEIWVEADQAGRLWDALMAAGRAYGILPTGILALDIARVEAGLLLLEVDYVPARQAEVASQTSTPYELGLGWTVKLDKGPFIGRQALAEQKRRGLKWKFVGIEVEWESLERLYWEFGLPPQLPTEAWRESVPVYSGRQWIGYATSGCWSPILKKYLAMGHLRAQYAKPGTPVKMEVKVEHQRKQAAARVVKKPFFDPERKRA